MWTVALYDAETWTLRRNEQKRLEAFEIRIWRRMERVSWIDKVKKCSCAGNGGRRKNNAGTDKEEEKKLAGPHAKKELPAEGCSRRNVNGKKVRDRRRYQLIDNIMIKTTL